MADRVRGRADDVDVARSGNAVAVTGPAVGFTDFR